MHIKHRFVHRDVDRHGNVRIYFWRKGGPKIRIREEPGSEAFAIRYHELLGGRDPTAARGPSVSRKPAPGTYRWLCVQFFGSTAFRALEQTTQDTYRRELEATFIEPIRPGATETFADFPLARIKTKSLRVLRDRKADLPGAARVRVTAIRAAFKWGLKQEHIANNPARDLEAPGKTGSGHHSWTTEEVEQYEQRHPVGTKARLALALLLWTGVRRSDVVLLGKQHLRKGWFKFTQYKNRKRKPVVTEIPLLPELQRIIEASPTGDLTFLVNESGRPFSGNSFSNWFAERCIEAKVPGRAHGLRKAGAATAAENGATSHELMAMFGWLSLQEAERYTRAAERKRMAGGAMSRIVRRGEQ
jgi:integrase